MCYIIITQRYFDIYKLSILFTLHQCVVYKMIKGLITGRISARLLKQILLKSNCQLHGEGFSPALEFSARAELRPGLTKSHVIEEKFQPG